MKVENTADIGLYVVNFTAAVVTSCTQRKASSNRVDIGQLPESASLFGLAQDWRRAVGEASANSAARNLYQGRSIADSAAVAATLGASLYVVSAGLGLIQASQLVPAYDCTVAAGTNLDRRLRALGSNPAQWWSALTGVSSNPLSRLIGKGPTLLALPGSYLQLVHDDLALVTAAQATSLRIFTSTAGAKYLPNHLLNYVMPYDGRLESVPGHAGTQADFAQRALRHFVEVLEATDRSAKEAQAAVAESLADHHGRQRSLGRRMTDDEILQVLSAQWTRHSGSSTKLLRYLRQEAGISCEQRRFSRLWRGLATKMRK
ncbi:hypothetical protein [Polycyclovorans algicola]|uniref:hypothetical protein n=1 Tax=Polycyclovorans algicola TaxID=616992 RepID=UPI001267E760|nr:hypothetical protein [Polycyclovorans algicola]